MIERVSQSARRSIYLSNAVAAGRDGSGDAPSVDARPLSVEPAKRRSRRERFEGTWVLFILGLDQYRECDRESVTRERAERLTF